MDVVYYDGSPEERRHMRETHLVSHHGQPPLASHAPSVVLGGSTLKAATLGACPHLLGSAVHVYNLREGGRLLEERARWWAAARPAGCARRDGAGTRRCARQNGENNFNVLLTHYDFIIKDKGVLSRVPWNYIVVDEGHRLKNDKSKLSQILMSTFSFKHRLLLTGTPIQNDLHELWALLNFLLPTIFSSAENFEEWFAKPFKGIDTSDAALNEEEQQLIIHRLHNVLRPFLLRRKKKEVEAELPDKVEHILHCDMSAWQKLVYKRILNKENLSDGKKQPRLQNIAMQLRKICNHPYLFIDEEEEDLLSDEDRIRASGKFELLRRLLAKLKATGHRVLLFSQMVQALHIVEDFVAHAGYKFLRLDGTTKNEDRKGQVDIWNAPDSEYFIFMLSTRAGGLGLNLQTADTVIIMDSDWNPQADLQAEDRAHRIGQTKEVRVFTLASKGTIDEHILRRAADKRLIDNKVIQAGMFNNNSDAGERQKMLEQVMRQGSDRLEGDLPSDFEINEKVARNEEEFLLFERMDAEWAERDEGRPRLLVRSFLVPRPPEAGRGGPSARAAMFAAPLAYPMLHESENELPEFAMREDPDEDEEEEAVFDPIREMEHMGVGKRKRGAVCYNEALTDAKWNKYILEEGRDPDVVNREVRYDQRKVKAAKLAEASGTRRGESTTDAATDGRAKAKATADAGGAGHDTEMNPAKLLELPASPDPPKKKRGRPPKNQKKE
ncbi:hypothetical protein CYMTET_16377 [Cymbomonas tetramitiformis]|uniref:Uncharacterized protein n=1 Tax=Cymbomonas tetramitiformis TaxID=36881 RepID=A0AAE0GCD0_9CHLO|nr:hypothetical protein CYMTET_16377 [Cymbomonas tetramitiformis]